MADLVGPGWYSGHAAGTWDHPLAGIGADGSQPLAAFPQGPGPRTFGFEVGAVGWRCPRPLFSLPRCWWERLCLSRSPISWFAAWAPRDEAWDLLFRSRTAATLGRTALLVVTVTGISVLISVPVAWLTTRTDLPLPQGVDPADRPAPGYPDLRWGVLVRLGFWARGVCFRTPWRHPLEWTGFRRSTGCQVPP